MLHFLDLPPVNHRQSALNYAFSAFINGIVEVIGRIGLPLLMMGPAGIGVWTIWMKQD